MEKVIAYKSFNGRLFESEEKCLLYEKKQKEFPKEKLSIEKAKDKYNVDGSVRVIDVFKHTLSIWEKPNSRRVDKFSYIVGGKYRFESKTINFVEFNNCLMLKVFLSSVPDLDWTKVSTYFAEQILLGNDLTDDFIKEHLKLINKANDYCKDAEMSVTILERNKKWEIGNTLSSKYDGYPPYYFTIEKIN